MLRTLLFSLALFTMVGVGAGYAGDSGYAPELENYNDGRIMTEEVLAQRVVSECGAGNCDGVIVTFTYTDEVIRLSADLECSIDVMAEQLAAGEVPVCALLPRVDDTDAITVVHAMSLSDVYFPDDPEYMYAEAAWQARNH